MKGVIFMDWTSILVAVITGGLAFLGVWVSNRRSGALIAYRLEQLEAKVDRHNHFAERMPVVEEQIKVANHRIEDLERKVDT